MHWLPRLGLLVTWLAAPHAGAQDLSCRQQAPSMPPLRWIAPPDEADQQTLERWCRTVGPPVWLSGATAPVDVDSLVVVSWNVHLGGGDIPAFLDSLRAGRLTDGRSVRHFVLLLQEVLRRDGGIPDASPQDPVPARIVAGPEERQDIVRVARSQELWLFYVPSMRNGADAAPDAEDRGNAILSTLPLENPTALELPFEGQRRVALLTDLRGERRGEARRLTLCNVHLDNRSGGARFFASFGTGRLRQVQFLVDRLPEAPVVLGGDFNTWMPSAMERTLAFLRRSFVEPPVDDRRPTYSRRLLPDRHVDHLYFQTATPPRVRRVENRFDSDHHPVLAWVSFQHLGRVPASPAGSP